jgi:hypothetical protein
VKKYAELCECPVCGAIVENPTPGTTTPLISAHDIPKKLEVLIEDTPDVKTH